MLQDLNQIILVGGITHCTDNWNYYCNSSLNKCFKLYMPLDGGAKLFLNDTVLELRPDRCYLINGEKIVRQECEEFMDIGWLHFVPVSLQLKYTLNKYFTCESWTYQELPFTKELLRIIGKAFSDGDKARVVKDYYEVTQKDVRFEIDDETFCKLQGTIIYLIGELLSKNNLRTSSQELAIFHKLAAAIEYMDQNINNNPPLSDIAATVFMAPNSFHRLFKQSFGITPHKYMQDKRLTKARQLLGTTKKTIQTIAIECGYENEFYFSRVFKREFDMSPSELRRKQFSG